MQECSSSCGGDILDSDCVKVFHEQTLSINFEPGIILLCILSTVRGVQENDKSICRILYIFTLLCREAAAHILLTHLENEQVFFYCFLMRRTDRHHHEQHQLCIHLASNVTGLFLAHCTCQADSQFLRKQSWILLC